jgi:hypothetical protein
MAKKTTKKLDGTTGMKLLHQEVNFGNALQLMWTMVGNINANLLDIKRDVADIKKNQEKNGTT